MERVPLELHGAELPPEQEAAVTAALNDVFSLMPAADEAPARQCRKPNTK